MSKQAHDHAVKPGPLTLPETGFVRLKIVLVHIPVSPSTWWEGVRSGRYPESVRLGPRITAWRVEDIRELIRRLGAGGDRRMMAPSISR